MMRQTYNGPIELTTKYGENTPPVYYGINSSTASIPLSSSSPPEASMIPNSTTDLSFVWGDGDGAPAGNMARKNDAVTFSTNIARSTNNWQRNNHGTYLGNAPSVTPSMPSYGSDSGDNSMIWTNPYPKKKAEIDRGTAGWGDPNKQGPIRRWKQCDETVTLPPNASAMDRQETAAENDAYFAGAAEKGDHRTISSAVETGSSTATKGWDDQLAKVAKQDSANSGSTWLSGDGKESSVEPKASSGWDFIPATNQADSITDPHKAFLSGRASSYFGSEQQNNFGGVSFEIGQYGGGAYQNVLPNAECFASNNPNAMSTSCLPSPGSVVTATPRFQMTEQLAAELKRYVQNGLLDDDIFRQLPPPALDMLQKFLIYAPKWERAKEELNQLQTNNSYGARQNAQQLLEEMKDLQRQMLECRARIRAIIGDQKAVTGYSKLDDWKRRVGNSSGRATPFQDASFTLTSGDVWSTSNTTSNYNADWSTMANANMTASRGNHLDMNKSLTDAEEDAAISAAIDEITQEPDEKGINRNTSTPVSGDLNTTASAIGGGSTDRSILSNSVGLNAFDADVPEFKPGQPWMWRDPKELAADPEATPASLNTKKAALSVNSGYGQPNLTTAMNAFGNDYNAFTNGFNGYHSNDTAVGHRYPKYGPNGYMTSTTRASSSWICPSPPAAAAYSWMPPITNAPPPPIRGAPPLQVIPSIPPSTVGIRNMPFAAMKPPMPPSSIGVQLPPPCQLQWVVLSNLNMHEQALSMLLQRIAPLASCICPPGAGFAAVKFKDGLEKILLRLHAECSALGIIVQLAKDDDISLLIQSIHGSQAGVVLF